MMEVKYMYWGGATMEMVDKEDVIGKSLSLIRKVLLVCW
jgi:hypothetical protein